MHPLDQDEPPMQDGTAHSAALMFGWCAIHDREGFDDLLVGIMTGTVPTS